MEGTTIDGVFVSEEKNQLREAILECTREEVRRTLFELLGKQSSKDVISNAHTEGQLHLHQFEQHLLSCTFC